MSRPNPVSTTPSVAGNNQPVGMYIYDAIDQRLVDERVAQFRDQTRRFLAGELSNDEFLPLRLMNGLYIQRHAPMLRIAIPYGLLSSTQLRMLARIARRYDKGIGHFTTRQNIQFNWIKLEEAPDVLADLASVQMHAIQTSGNCIRNVTTDHLAGVAADELEDPRPYCEIIRQWSTFHPEFTFLPRKFKIAVTGATRDRAATLVHDIGLRLVKNDSGEIGFHVLVGGGLGRTPMIGQTIRKFLSKTDLLSYLEAILRVYNLHGRRDNKYKARIKILVGSLGIDAFRDQVEREWQRIRAGMELDRAEIERVQAFFRPLATAPARVDGQFQQQQAQHPAFARWVQYNVAAHKVAGYRIAFISLKAHGIAPGDITAEQMEIVADLADRYSGSLIRSTHNQNLALTDVRETELYRLWQELSAHNLAMPNIGTLTDMICCPGLDFCELANASSISIAKDIQARFDNIDYLYDLGEIRLKMSGCMNGCGHHDIGDIGILGVDKKGEEWYQLSLGGFAENEGRLAERLGRAIAKADVAATVETIVRTYLSHRVEGERFVDTYNRIGIEPFREQIYGNH